MLLTSLPFKLVTSLLAEILVDQALSGSSKSFMDRMLSLDLVSRTRIIIQFSENPPPWKSDRISHPHSPQVMSDHSGLPSARTHAFPYPWCHLAVIFHPLTPILSLAISPHLSMLYLDLTPIPFHICSLFSPTEIILG